MVSVIVPIFNEEGTVQELHERIVAAMKKQGFPYEIIFVNDGSNDRTYEIAKQLKPLTLVTHQRNYGETPAFDTGIEQASGDIIVFIDADLQDDPAEIPLLLKKIDEGYDVAVGWRQKRNDHWTRVVFSRFANIIVWLILDLKLHDYGCGLKAYRSKFIKDFRLWGNVQVFLPVIAKERGAKVCEVPVSNYFRKSGAAKIKILNMIKGGFDLLSFAFFIKYFSKPLRFFGGWGTVSIILSIIAFGAA
ncbi:MAG: glycosyltransferase family 2 protein, partial [Patescibacteria group bacterium]